jgi:hypothetical protein
MFLIIVSACWDIENNKKIQIALKILLILSRV